MLSFQPRRQTGATARPSIEPANRATPTKPTLPDDVLVRVVQAVRPTHPS